jgi:hydroxymethylpyrimidine pyrophosphatase-like HAD family hydrolase
MPIRLLVFDIDGVLTQREGKAFDLPLLERLADMNRAAREDPAHPAITLCTGRPAAYVEAMLRAIDGRVPAVFENGAGLYLPDGYRFLPHPMLKNRPSFQEVQQRLEEALVRTGQAFLQPGKEYSLSILACDPSQTDALYGLVVTSLGPLRETVDLVYSVSCLNVVPRDIHKGKGIEFLSSQTDYSVGEMLGVGDSGVDLPFLDVVGYSAAPANANPKVKRLAQYVAPRPAADGVRDILDHFGLTP